jgi:hypothetical protein
MRRARLSILLLAAIAAALVLGLSGAAGAGRARVASGKPFAAKLSYTETNHGRSQGSRTVGIQGKGHFSVRLGARAAIAATFIALMTGVPLTKIATGGSYTVQRNIAGNGVVTGLAVVKLKAPGLGVVCVSYTEAPGKFVPGSSFVPMSGAIKTVGGVGAAARWRGSVTFKQTSVTGSTVEQFGAKGSEQATLGNPRPMTAACKHVAAIR